MRTGDPRRVPVEGELTILTAAGHKERLLTALQGGTGLRLDLSGVEEIDTAGLQILLLVRREAALLNLAVEFADPSRAVAEVLELVRLAPDSDDLVEV